MRLLLDSHVVLWYFSAPDKLRPASYAAIRNIENQVFISAASIWEIAIKKSIGKLECPDDLLEQIGDEREQIQILQISASHSWLAGHLPPHHNDPFDRMILAQAEVAGMTIITRDGQFKLYGLPLLEA